MSDAPIGNAVIEIAADASKLKAGVSDAKTSLMSLRDSAREAGESLTNSSTKYLLSLERQTASMERQAATFGKSKAAIADFTAAQQGVSSTAATMVTRLSAAEVSLKAQATAAKLAAAGHEEINFSSMRAQRGILGLAKSLAEGNFPLAGIEMTKLAVHTGLSSLAFSALGIAVLGTLAVFGAFAVAMVKGRAESDAYNKALVLTGNYAGTTTEKLSDMARTISQSSGTQGKAAEVLVELAATGKIAANQFDEIATAAIAMERAGGPAVKTIIAEMIKLGDEPAKASAKLNETMHYLTLAVYEQIRALEEQGRTEEAAVLAQKSYTQAIQQRADELGKSLGYMSRAWAAVKDAAKSAWDAMSNIGRPVAASDQIANLSRQIEAAVSVRKTAISQGQGENNLKYINALNAQMQALLATNQAKEHATALSAETGKVEQASVVAAAKLGVQIEANSSKTEKMNKELATTKLLFDKVRASADSPERTALLAKEEGEYANIRAKNKDTAPKAMRDDAGARMLMTLRAQTAEFVLQLESETTLTSSEKERAKFVQLLLDLKGKVLTDEQKSLLASKDAILTQLGINVAAEKSINLKKDQTAEDVKNAALAKAEDDRRLKALESFRLQVVALDKTMAASAEQQKEQGDRTLSVFGLGKEAAAQMAASKTIYKEYFDYLKRLNEQAAKEGALGSDDYASGVANIKAGLAAALKVHDDYYAELATKQADWKNGAKEAISDYVATAKNLAQQSNEAFTHAFKGMEDALVTFVTTGKLSFSSLASSILADLARIIIKQQMAAMLTAAIGGTGGAGGWLGMLLGAAGGGGGGSGVVAGGGGIKFGATGGDFAANTLVRVNERGPEMLTVGGRDMLMLGSQPGHITPNSGNTSGPNVTFNVASGVSRNELAAMFPAMKAQIKAEVMSTMRRPGYQRS